MRRLLSGLSALFMSGENDLGGPRDKDGRIRHTERALAILLTVATGSFSLLVLCGIIRRFFISFDLAQFILWSGLTALAAWLSGAMLGMLFGLPSVREVRIADGGAGAGSLAATGYQESTNLEQVADWVTKILIGLTLTQYSFWEAAFSRAFTQAGRLMLGDPGAGPASATIIAAAFAMDGFLIAYLAMRRYFIREMVAGRGEAQEQLDELMREKAAAGLLQQQASVTAAPAQLASDARSMAAKAVQLQPVASAEAAKEIVAETTQFPDDPWRDKFGGVPAAAGCTLGATVTPLDGDATRFTLRLMLKAEDPAARTGQTATFYLHPTFGPEPKKVAFGPEGQATLDLIAYGAFTVGVLLEDGAKLELNLATLPEAPESFRTR
jgi:hypothetical protein